MNYIFKCKLRIEDKMAIEHVTTKEACITGMKMRGWEEQSIHSLQKLNPITSNFQPFIGFLQYSQTL